MKLLLLASAFSLVALSASAQNKVGGAITGDMTSANVQSGQNQAISTGQLGSNIGDTSTTSSASGGSARAAARGGSVTNTITGTGGGGGGSTTIRNTPSTLQSLALAYCGKGGGISGVGPGFGAGISWGSMEDRCLHIQAAVVACQVLNDCEWGRQLLAIDPAWRQANENARQVDARRAPPATAEVPSYCRKGREVGASDRLMIEWNCPR